MFYATVKCDGEALIKAARLDHFQFDPHGGSSGRFLINDAKEEHDDWVKFMNWNQGPSGECLLLAADGRSARIAIGNRNKSSTAPLLTEVDFTPNTDLE